jgi:hypothetical protein
MENHVPTTIEEWVCCWMVVIARLAMKHLAAGPRLGLRNDCPEQKGFWQRAAADLVNRRITATDLIPQSPLQMQAVAPRVVHLSLHAMASRVFDLECGPIRQAPATKVFHRDQHSIERASAPKLVHLNRYYLAPRIFHIYHRFALVASYTKIILQRT